ncbi:hypothetical protein [Geotoga petraea]|uniref:Uncharacterized protein n=1 Tax=Geotoga petraea TaxID=28234 RepID=A0A1G6LPC5_9BACT|nr:hypothetical protein [Geotoga petraea]SDC44927.1 hypothetical protein SAMN04488588_1098 [Geotoga petraea]
MLREIQIIYKESEYTLLEDSLSLLPVIYEEEDFLKLQFSSEDLFEILDYLKDFNIEVVLYEGILNIKGFISLCEVIYGEATYNCPKEEKNL